MAEHALECCVQPLDAFTSSDAAAAREIIKSDTEINDLYNHLFHHLIEMMVTEPATATRDARLLFVAKHLERIGDYVTDICELTVYMAEAALSSTFTKSMARPVLIIEDDPDISESLKYNFEREGLTTVTALTGEAGLMRL